MCLGFWKTLHMQLVQTTRTPPKFDTSLERVNLGHLHLTSELFSCFLFGQGAAMLCFQSRGMSAKKGSVCFFFAFLSDAPTTCRQKKTSRQQTPSLRVQSASTFGRSQVASRSRGSGHGDQRSESGGDDAKPRDLEGGSRCAKGGRGCCRRSCSATSRDTDTKMMTPIKRTRKLGSERRRLQRG